MGELEDQRVRGHDREAGDPPVEQIEAPRLEPPPQRDRECREAGQENPRLQSVSSE